MFFLAALCLVAGILPGPFIDTLAPVAKGLVGDRMPTQTAVEWLSIVPVAESRSSYNGMLVFLFIAISATFAAFTIHRLASNALRRAPLWDCGYPNAGPATQYTAGSFAQPIRRVFGTVVFRAREHVEMPPPGDGRPARFNVDLRDLIWDTLYAPVADGIVFAYLGKLLVGGFLLALFETTIAKMRVFRVPEFLGAALMLGLLGTLLLFVSRASRCAVLFSISLTCSPAPLCS